MILDLDYESRSCVDLTSVGIHNYASHPSTEIILASFSIDEGPIKLWQPHLEPIPQELKWALEDPLVEQKWAFNVAFERIMTRHCLGIHVPIEEWRDVQVMARYYSLPGNLEDVGTILNIESQKLKEGKELIRLFCVPFIDQKDTPLFGPTEPVFKDWSTNPVEWERFCKYNIQDTRAQQEERRKLKDFDLPKQEWKNWFLSENINDRGLFVDMDLVNGATQVVEREQDRLETELKSLTGVNNANSRNQILEWLRGEGYIFSSVGKNFIKRSLDGEGKLTEKAVRALNLRTQLAKSGTDKLKIFRSMTCDDLYLRDSFSFMGASRTGRFNSRGINIQNLTRPDKEVNESLEEAVVLLKSADYDGVSRRYKCSVLDAASSILRPVFASPSGTKMIIADLNAIEPRVSAWISGCQTMLDIFIKGLDPYKSFGAELFKKPYDQISKEERNMSKPPLLGCSYRLSGGEEIINDDNDKVYTGLLAYARSMGVELTKEFADRAVEIFRKKYREIPKFWYTLEDAYKSAVLDGDVIDLGKLKFYMKQNTLCMELPSGRCLHYINPQVEENVLVQGPKGEYEKTVYSHDATDKNTMQWGRVTTHGGVLIENATQAIARDVLLEGMREAERVGFDIRLHVHDEIMSYISLDSTLTVKDLEYAMAKQISWAPDLPLGAEGFETNFYRKN